ncbi:Oxidoreductase, partial [Ascosphaera acerosa]
SVAEKLGVTIDPTKPSPSPSSSPASSASELPPSPAPLQSQQTIDSILAEREPSSPQPQQDEEGGDPSLMTPGELHDEASSQGAFNEETGEINWDCPCLGGMAHGPCGEEFKAAFSCFVYSKEEPKGMDCIDKFKGMQDCFRLHPEIYGSELEEDELEAEAHKADADAAPDAGAHASAAPSAPAEVPVAAAAEAGVEAIAKTATLGDKAAATLGEAR